MNGAIAALFFSFSVAEKMGLCATYFWKNMTNKQTKLHKLWDTRKNVLLIQKECVGFLWALCHGKFAISFMIVRPFLYQVLSHIPWQRYNYRYQPFYTDMTECHGHSMDILFMCHYTTDIEINSMSSRCHVLFPREEIWNKYHYLSLIYEGLQQMSDDSYHKEAYLIIIKNRVFLTQFRLNEWSFHSASIFNDLLGRTPYTMYGNACI